MHSMLLRQYSSWSLIYFIRFKNIWKFRNIYSSSNIFQQLSFDTFYFLDFNICIKFSSNTFILTFTKCKMHVIWALTWKLWSKIWKTQTLINTLFIVENPSVFVNCLTNTRYVRKNRRVEAQIIRIKNEIRD